MVERVVMKVVRVVVISPVPSCDWSLKFYQRGVPQSDEGRLGGDGGEGGGDGGEGGGDGGEGGGDGGEGGGDGGEGGEGGVPWESNCAIIASLVRRELG